MKKQTFKTHMNSESGAVEASEIKYSETLRGAKQIAKRAVNTWAMEAIIFQSLGQDDARNHGYNRVAVVK